jgi:hypothetical protein
MAGESTNDAARRRREHAERLTGGGALSRRSGAGRATARALASLPASWTVFHDVVWPGRRGARIDHVVVGGSGIFVIDSQVWQGPVSVREDVLHEDGRPREGAVASAAEAALQIGQLSKRLAITHAVICFATDEDVTGRSRDVLLCSPATLVDVLTSRTTLLSAGQVRQVAQELDGQLRAAAAALGPVIPLPRGPVDPPRSRARPTTPDEGTERRVRIIAAPRHAATRHAPRGRGGEGRRLRRALRAVLLLAVVIVALVAAVVFADQLRSVAAGLGDLAGWIVD